MWEKYSEIVPHIEVDSGVIDHVAGWALSSGYKSLIVVSDPNTHQVAGCRVIESLKTAGLTVHDCCFAENEPIPDEYAIGFLTAALTPDIDLILGVGSGTINDICTFVGARVGCPSAIVGTAPSMDGYASLGSAMLINGVKVTPPTQCPVAIFCDIDILKEAPMLLTAAGLGDMLGKFTALADWRLAHLLVNEPMPDDIASIVEDALSKIIAGAPQLASRNPAVIKNVTEGLILSGIAMSLYGDSRPASGTEHHLAHFWEMRMLAEGRKPALHGIKVGLAAIIGLVIWKEIADCEMQFDEAPPMHGTRVENSLHEACTRADYRSEIHRLYGPSSDAILLSENPSLSINHIYSNHRAILEIANSLPKPEDIAAMLSAADAPVRPSDIGLSADMLRDSIVYARDRKKVYTVLQMLGNMGCLEDFALRVDRYFADTALSGVKCFVMDMDGTIYLGDKVFSYTEHFLNCLRETGKDYIFYTNNSSQNAEHYINKLQRMGITVPPEKLMMSTQVLLAFLKEHRENHLPVTSRHENRPPVPARVFVAGTEALRGDFTAAGYTLTENDPDFAVLGFDTDMDYKRLTRLCDLVRSGVPYFGVHIDYNCPVEGGFIPDCGSIAAAVTASTGITPEFFGKPSRRTLDFIVKKTGYREDELCFVGDRLYTDIAIASGTRSRSVLVLSGETKRIDLRGSAFIPDLVVGDLAELMDYIG